MTRRYDQNFRIELMNKDVSLCLQEAEKLGVPMWLGAAVRQYWQFTMTQGMATQDSSRIAALVEQWAGSKRTAVPLGTMTTQNELAAPDISSPCPRPSAGGKSALVTPPGAASGCRRSRDGESGSTCHPRGPVVRRDRKPRARD